MVRILKQAAVLACLSWAGPLQVSAGDPEDNAAAQYKAASLLQTGGMYKSAAAAWERFLNRYPEDRLIASAMNRLGWCYVSLKRYSEAARVFANASALYPASPDLRLMLSGLAFAHFKLAETGKYTYADAAEDFRRVVAAAPNSDDAKQALTFMAYCHVRDGHLDDAHNSIQELLTRWKSGPFVADAWFLRGLIDEKSGKYEQAAESFNTLISGWPKHNKLANAHLHLGQISVRERKYSQAAEHFRKASDDPKSSVADVALYDLGRALEENGSDEDAHAAFASMSRRFPKSKFAEKAKVACLRLEESAAVRDALLQSRTEKKID